MLPLLLPRHHRRASFHAVNHRRALPCSFRFHAYHCRAALSMYSPSRTTTIVPPSTLPIIVNCQQLFIFLKGDMFSLYLSPHRCSYSFFPTASHRRVPPYSPCVWWLVKHAKNYVFPFFFAFCMIIFAIWVVV